MLTADTMELSAHLLFLKRTEGVSLEFNALKLTKSQKKNSGYDRANNNLIYG